MGTNEKTEPKKVEELKKVQFDPSDFIKFEGKLEDIQKKKVTVTNKSQSVITFKCKGTSPNHIKIRPAYAFIKPNERTVILVRISREENLKLYYGKRFLDRSFTVKQSTSTTCQ